MEGDVLVLTGQARNFASSGSRYRPRPSSSAPQGVLDGLIAGDTVSSTVGDPATLVLHADGTLEGSTGCRTLGGTYRVEGDRFLVEELNTEGECPADVAAQDAHVLHVLGDGFRASLTGELLTLRPPAVPASSTAPARVELRDPRPPCAEFGA